MFLYMDSKEKLKGDIGEQAVNTLASDTYLKYWCYPSPRDEKGSKKEICDLLILFRDTAIILSVKNYAFKGNYERYFRSTLDKAISQVAGAERKLFNGKNKVYIRHPDLGEHRFDSSIYKTVHRIIINHNTAPLFYPAGRLTSSSKYVHIFNWDAFLGVVNELNTIPDFIGYLEERSTIFQKRDVTMMNGSETDWSQEVNRAFISYNSNRDYNGNGFLLISGSELDLLADFNWNDRRFNKAFYAKNYKVGSFKFDGKWERYLAQKEVQNKKAADRASYFVDEFVKREVLYSYQPMNLKLAIELLSLSRFERRMVGSEFLALATQYKNVGRRFVARRYGKVTDLVIAFVLYSRDMPHHVVMQLLEIAAEGYAYWNKYQDSKIAIIGFSQDMTGFKFGLMEVEPFSKERENQVIQDLKMLNWFSNIEAFHVTHKEYPDT